MSGLENLLQILSSSADIAIVAVAYFLWKMDRRLLTVELQMKSMWKQFGKKENHDA